MADTSWKPGTCSIVGIGTTDYSKSSGRSTLTLAAQASRAALADAGIDPREVDGIVRCDMDLVSAPALADSLGVHDLTYWGETGPGGSGPAAMVGQAVAAVSAGLATTVVVFRSLNGRSGNRYGLVGGRGAIGGDGSYDEFFLPYGMQTPGQFFAVVARRYAHEHRLSLDELAYGLGSIALASRAHANNNPDAQFHSRTMTRDDYLASRMLSDPLRLFDFCLETDGAAAVVVTTTERARDLRGAAVPILSVAQGTGRGVQPGQMFPALLRPSITSWPSAVTAPTVFGRAGISSGDIDVAQIYDCFTITALIQLEDYGFVDRGRAAHLSQVDLSVGGLLPLNTSGGHLSEGYVHGMNHIVEGVRQIRGTSTNQVEGAELSFVTSAPPPGASALVLGADR
ncbi:MAG: lipid-transfer protein [Rhodococcus sp. (in: high G+C Gram-positive bacteria)]|uniref:thiolase C-terminal domain-containing protein n=1 Tax=Rhodococcus sp. TaxID=1831 RepID=UPI00121BCE8B|nr:lipid-transfer protein [Rhodococcus sp. (in: high G+C Gram-positive bacteria)]RZL23106.1 MAG: lipid-transfer protein [Rhodococcus sp. (in: high G+C Gram-positive bacteria)]